MQPVQETQTNASTLPEWNLADLYPGVDSPALAVDFERAARESNDFATKYPGRLAELAVDKQASEKLGEAVARYEALQDLLGRIMSFASLLHAGNVTDPARAKFYADARDKIVDASTKLLFFQLELNRIDDAILDRAAQIRRWRIGGPGSKTSARKSLMSSTTSLKSCSTRNPSLARAAGIGCSTRPSPPCGLRWMAGNWRSSPCSI